VLYVGINNAPEDADGSLGEHTAAGPWPPWRRWHGIPADVIDGTDVLNVYARALAVVAKLRGGRGPSFLECRCFPLDEPSRAQVQEWKDEMRRAGQYTSMLMLKKKQDWQGRAEATRALVSWRPTPQIGTTHPHP